MGVSKNSGTPKSSILMGCSTINHPFSGTTIFGNTHVSVGTNKETTKQSLHFRPETAGPGWGFWGVLVVSGTPPNLHRKVGLKGPNPMEWIQCLANLQKQQLCTLGVSNQK